MQCSMIALRIVLGIASIAEVSCSMITNYEPETNVEQLSYIDLDQAELETHLQAGDFTKATQIYTIGGNSGATAEITVPALEASVAKGARVGQEGSSAAQGYMKKRARAGETTVTISYESKCKEGGSSSPDTAGCFTVDGELSTSDGVKIGVPSAVVNKYRTLAGFSTTAKEKMSGQEYYLVYRAYYQDHDYAHQFVMGALDGTGKFAGKDDVFRMECAKKGSAYQNVWMSVIHEMEDAIMDCQVGCLKCNEDPVHAWDEAVAFYSGSLEGRTGDSSGKLLYRLAEQQCANFGTCTGSAGHAAVNAKIIDEFRLGQSALNLGKCVEVIPKKRRIVELMSVPLVQGALRYAYKVDQLTGGSKEKAEGAAFAAAILPRIAACNSDAAKLISDNMMVNSASPMKDGFARVKETFESAYDCLGITCSDVGGLLSIEKNKYYAMAEPCGPASIPPSPTVTVMETEEVEVEVEVEKIPMWALIVIIVAAVLLVLVCCAAVFFFTKASKYQQMAEGGGSGKTGTTIGAQA